ncbi:MAG: CO dehydrogenase/acetyl-CoA synthase subunit delta [Nitrososphaerota archaeon]
MAEKDKEKPVLHLGARLFETLARFSEIELENVEINVGELEIHFMPGAAPRLVIPAPKAEAPATAVPAKPIELLPSEFRVPKREYPGRIVEVTLGATKSQGGSRGRAIVIGGETAPAWYLFENAPPHIPVFAFDVFDKAPPLAKAMRDPFADVLNDPAEWARKGVEKYDADMINLHLTSTDPRVADTSPEEAAKTVERVLQAVDVPLSVGGCGDREKDLRVFEKVAEVAEGERLLFNSVSLDMDVQKAAEVIKKHRHVALAFTSMDMAKARELNRRLYEVLPREDIVIDTTTAALGYGLDYAFSIMERTRLAALMGDSELQHPMASGTTNAWAAREAWMKMAPEWGPRELRGPIWETVTALTLLFAGVDFFMMISPAAVKTVKDVIAELMSGNRGDPAKAMEWVSAKLGG